MILLFFFSVVQFPSVHKKSGAPLQDGSSSLITIMCPSLCRCIAVHTPGPGAPSPLLLLPLAAAAPSSPAPLQTSLAARLRLLLLLKLPPLLPGQLTPTLRLLLLPHLQQHNSVAASNASRCTSHTCPPPIQLSYTRFACARARLTCSRVLKV